MSSAAQQYQKILDAHRWRITTSDYMRMAEAGTWSEDDKVELIHGEIINMSPINSLHAGTVNRIHAFILRVLGDACIVAVQNPIEIPDHSMPEPDIVVARYREDYYTSRHPQPDDILLIIEVADTSMPMDKHVKTPLYAEAGIPEYWIVDLQRKCIEVYRKPQKDRYTEFHEFTGADTFHCALWEGEIRVGDLLIV